MVKKLFALASVTALTGFVSAGSTAGCSSTEVVTVPADSGGAGVVDSGKGKSSSGGSTGKPANPVPGDDDDDGGGSTPEPTCLSKDPIDASKIEYTKGQKAVKGKCSAKELTDLSAYYKAHGSEDDFTVTTWKGSVSDGCAACIFTETSDADPAKTWGPIVVKDDQIDTVNRGGCVEAVSGKESCGRAYQQYQTCLVDACLKDCKTAADYQACRQDSTVLTTACKGAVDALKTECGSQVGTYETACKGTSYTFEGPIKVLCVNGTTTTVKDAATKD